MPAGRPSKKSKKKAPKRLKWQLFADYYVANGGNGTQSSKDAGYNFKNDKGHQVYASQLLKRPQVYEYIHSLVTDLSKHIIMPVIERKQVLSDIGRAKMSDFVSKSLDGQEFVEFSKDTLHSAAIKKVKTKRYEGKNESMTILTEMELHDPKSAIQALNDMESIGGRNRALSAEVKKDKNGNIESINVTLKESTEELSEEVKKFRADMPTE